MKQNLIISIALHALVGGAVFFFSAIEIPKTLDVIQFEIESPSSLEKKLDFAGTSAHPSRHGKSAQNKSRGANLNLFGSGYIADSRHRNSDDLVLPSTDFKDGTRYIGDAEGFISDGNQWSYFEQVYKKVDEQLVFDSLLAQYNHFGTVYVEFEVDAKGRFVEKGLKVSADDGILKVHVLRALIKGLRVSFDSTKWNPTGKAQIFQAQFRFIRDGDFYLNKKKQSAFAKPVLAFTRYTAEKPIPTNLQEHLLSGGLDYDLFAAAERWQKYSKRKKLREQEFDPFSTYKSDPLYNL